MTEAGQKAIPSYSAFTTRCNGQRSLVLASDVGLCPAFAPPSPPPDVKSFRALYDTGATHSAISPRVVEALGLASIGTATVGTAKGSHETTTHLVNIGLPNKVMFQMVRVTMAELDTKIDVLIGMDILGEGDFAITNFQGKTMFSFCYPSRREIDFVSEIRESMKPIPVHSAKTSRNARCLCGSGKKHKYCCGKGA